jgi:protein involved in polysaccharide export with SLBB domain
VRYAGDHDQTLTLRQLSHSDQAMKPLWKISQRIFLWLVLSFIAGLIGGGCQTTKKDFSFSTVPEGELVESGSSAERIAPGETITVRLPGSEPHVERAKEDGTVTLPLIGVVEVAGKTAEELQRVVYDLYVPRYYKSLPFSVPRRAYYVTGQVRSPGRQDYIGPTTVLKAIVSAGDFTEFAARWYVVLTRAHGERLLVHCIKAAKEPALDLPVYPGDKIEVPLRTRPNWRILESR